MGNQYDGILSNYHVDQYLQEYEAGHKAIRDSVRRVYILGESLTVQGTIAALFSLQQYRWPHCVTAPLPLSLCSGPEKKYWLMDNGVKSACSEEEFFHCRTVEQSMDVNAPNIHGGIILTAGIPAGMEVTALGIDETDHLDEILVDADICVLTMSATRVLTLLDKKILKHPMNTTKICLLKDLDGLSSESDRQEVLSVVESALNGEGALYCLPLQEDTELLLQSWMNLTGVPEARVERLKLKYLAPVKEALENAQKDADQARKKAEQVANARQKFPSFKDRAYRRIKTYCVDNIKTDADSKFLMFYEQLNQDIAEGIREESDVKALQEQLFNFIAGEWDHFLEDDAKPSLNAEINQEVPRILAFIQDSSEGMLRELLEESEIAHLHRICSTNAAFISPKGTAGEFSADGIFAGNTGDALRSALPKCMIALGGITLLSGGLLTGAVLLAAGISGSSTAKEEAKAELVSAGRQWNGQFFRQSQACTEAFSSDVMAEVEDLLDEVCEQTVDAMRQIEEAYQKENVQITAQIASACAALDALQR